MMVWIAHVGPALQASGVATSIRFLVWGATTAPHLSDKAKCCGWKVPAATFLS